MDIMDVLIDTLKNNDKIVPIIFKYYGSTDENNDEEEYNPYGPSEPIFPVLDMIQKVIYNDECTIIIWKDGVKTIVRQGEYDEYDREKALAMGIVKRICGNVGNYNDIFKVFNAYDD